MDNFQTGEVFAGSNHTGNLPVPRCSQFIVKFKKKKKKTIDKQFLDNLKSRFE